MSSQAPLPPQDADESVENRYYQYLRGHGYSTTAALLDVLRVYLPHLAGRQHVADIGCGHGEMLTLLAQAGHTVSGVDVDPGMVAACRAQGLDVQLGDAVAWLDAHPQGFDAVFSSNVIEHLPAETVVAWTAAAYRALRPGGLLLFATPNPESIVVQLHEFWRDPTHVRLYSRQLLEFFLTDAGFTDVRSLANPAAVWEGTDLLHKGIFDELPPAPVVPLPVGLTPMPQAPEPGADLRHTIASRVALFVFAKLTKPFIEPLQADLKRHQDAIHAQAAAFQAEHENLRFFQKRIRQLAEADSYLHPSREIYVIGVKPQPA